MQCEAGNVFPMVLLIAMQYAIAFLRQGGGLSRFVLLIVVLISAVAAFMYSLNVRGIDHLTMAHLLHGMTTFEFALRLAKEPQFNIRSRLEFLLVFSLIFPNLILTLSETCCPLHGFPSMPHLISLETWSHKEFYGKQHAVINGGATAVLISFCSSYWPRLRRSPRVQLARICIEPTCLVVIAMVLMTHDHFAGSATTHELDNHPVIGTFICVAALCQTVSALVHYATSGGEPVDLSTPLPGGGPAHLLALRLVTSFAFLLLSSMIHITTLMEYLGCRMVIVKVGDANDRSRIGWSPAIEVSTYKAAAFLIAGLAFAFVIVPLSGDRRSKDYAQVSLLPLSHAHAQEKASLLPAADDTTEETIEAKPTACPGTA